jgi:glutathione synthase
MRLLFVSDPEESFKTHKDSTFAMMREAARRHLDVWVCQPCELAWQRGGRVSARKARQLRLSDAALSSQYGQGVDDWYSVSEIVDLALADVDAVLMRKDPPFDAEYFYATHLLAQAEREGARVFNSPRALREHPEKLAILEFPEFIAPTLVTRSAQAIRAFHAEQGDIILKPLDGMGGTGIFRVGPDALNLGSIIETLGGDGARTLMVQRYLPAIAQGDKRIVLINGQAVDYALARIPQGSEVRGNLAAGGKGVAQPLSPRDREIAAALGPTLAQRGLLLVGLDVIGDHLTEINVTSPTCFQEISQQAGLDVAALFLDALMARLPQPSQKTIQR